MAFSDRKPSEDFNNLQSGNTVPTDLHGDSQYLWVVNSTSNSTIYRYNLSTKAYVNTLNYGFVVRGLTGDATHYWISRSGSTTLLAFNLSTGYRDSAKDITVQNPSRLTSHGDTIWVLDHNSDAINAYDKTTKAKVDNLSFTGAQTNPAFIDGIWTDGETMWGSDNQTNAEKIWAWNIATKQRDISKEFNTLEAAGNTHAQGIWSDGTTMWVADSVDDKIYAYELFSGFFGVHQVINNTINTNRHISIKENNVMYTVKNKDIKIGNEWRTVHVAE